MRLLNLVLDVIGLDIHYVKRVRIRSYSGPNAGKFGPE